MERPPVAGVGSPLRVSVRGRNVSLPERGTVSEDRGLDTGTRTVGHPTRERLQNRQRSRLLQQESVLPGGRTTGPGSVPDRSPPERHTLPRRRRRREPGRNPSHPTGVERVTDRGLLSPSLCTEPVTRGETGRNGPTRVVVW